MDFIEEWCFSHFNLSHKRLKGIVEDILTYEIDEDDEGPIYDIICQKLHGKIEKNEKNFIKLIKESQDCILKRKFNWDKFQKNHLLPFLDDNKPIIMNQPRSPAIKENIINPVIEDDQLGIDRELHVKIIGYTKEVYDTLCKYSQQIKNGFPEFFQNEITRWVERREAIREELKEADQNILNESEKERKKEEIEERMNNLFLFEDIEHTETVSRERPLKFFKQSFRYSLIPRKEVAILILINDQKWDISQDYDEDVSSFVVHSKNVEIVLSPNHNIENRTLYYLGTTPVINSFKKGIESPLMRFIRMIAFFCPNDGRLPFVSQKAVENGLREVEKLIGGSNLAERMKKELEFMTDESCKVDRGFLFWGPPGTGKSTIIKKLMESMGLVTICEFLTAASFQQGIVGESPKMLAELSKRSNSVPWEMCVVAIDEVDGLVADRSSEGSSHSVNIMAQLLGMFGGLTDEKENLVLMATTNRRDKIDAAFLRRSKSIFVGRPSFDERKEWIMASEANNPLRIMFNVDKRKSLTFLHNSEDELTKMTMNFSHDAMAKLMRKLLHRYGSPQAPQLGANILKEVVKEVASQDNLKFGQYFVPTLLERTKLDVKTHTELVTLENPPNASYVDPLITSFWGLHQNAAQDSPIRRIMLVDLQAPVSANGYRDHFQVLYQSSARLDGRQNQFLEEFDRHIKESSGREILTKTREFLSTFGTVLDEPLLQKVNAQLEVLENHVINLETEYNGENIIDSYRKVQHEICISLAEYLQQCFTNLPESFWNNQYHNPMMRSLDECHGIMCAGEFLIYDEHGMSYTCSCHNESVRNERAEAQILTNFQDKIKTMYVEKEMEKLLDMYPSMRQNIKTKKKLVRQLLTWDLPKLSVAPDKLEMSLSVLLIFARDNGIHFVQLVDSLYLLEKECTDDEKASHLIETLLMEGGEYESSMIIFDLDSLAGLQINWGGLKSEITSSTPTESEGGMASLHYSEARPNTLLSTLNIARSSIVGSNSMSWIVCVSSNPYLTRKFKAHLDWLTQEDKAKIEKDKESRVLKSCACCRKKYKEIDNEPSACGRHSVDLIRIEDETEAGPDGKKPPKNDRFVTFSEAQRMVLNKECKASQCHWVCCGGELWAQGEIGYPHTDIFKIHGH